MWLILENVSSALVKMCILLGGEFTICLLGVSFILLFKSAVYWFSVWTFYLLLKVKHWSLILLLYCCQFLPSDLSVTICFMYLVSDVGRVYNCYILRLNWLFLITIFVSRQILAWSLFWLSTSILDFSYHLHAIFFFFLNSLTLCVYVILVLFFVTVSKYLRKTT
jgi:hypothetical protein